MTLRTPIQRLYSITRTLRDEAQDHHRHGRELEAAALEHYAVMLDEIREQLAQAGAAPPGWRLVPREPTPDMIEALYSQVRDEACYQQMLAVSPLPGGAS